MRRSLLLLFAAAAPCLIGLSAAHASEPETSAPSEREGDSIQPSPRWYGKPSLILDGAGLASEALGFAWMASLKKSDSVGFEAIPLVFGAGAYMFGPPAVHLANHHGWRALGSLLLRGYAPPAFGYGLLAIVRGGNPSDINSDGCRSLAAG